MAQQTRTTIKTYFETGDTPTEAQFIDLIDSALNITDDDTDDITEGTAKFTTAADISKLAGIEAGADVTDVTNVTAAGALMDSELASIADVKALDQSVISGASPTFGTANLTDATDKRLMSDAQETKLDSVETNADVTDATNVDAAGATMNTDADVSGNTWVLDEDGLSTDSNTKVPTQQSVKAYADTKGDKEITFEAQTGASYTLVLADNGKVVTMSNGAGNTLTVPPNASVAFPTGTQIVIVQKGAGQTTIAEGSGVTINSADGDLKLRAQYSSASLIKESTNVWYLVGDIDA